MGAIQPERGDHFVGPVPYWVEELIGLREIGMDSFVFWPGTDDPLGQVELFASEVAPEVRAASVAG